MQPSISPQDILRGAHPTIKVQRVLDAPIPIVKTYEQAFIELYNSSTTFKKMLDIVEKSGEPLFISIEDTKFVDDKAAAYTFEDPLTKDKNYIVLDSEFANTETNMQKIAAQIAWANEMLHAVQYSLNADDGREVSQAEFESDLATYQVMREVGVNMPGILGNHKSPDTLDDRYDSLAAMGVDEREIIGVTGRDDLIARYGITAEETAAGQQGLPVIVTEIGIDNMDQPAQPTKTAIAFGGFVGHGNRPNPNWSIPSDKGIFTQEMLDRQANGGATAMALRQTALLTDALSGAFSEAAEAAADPAYILPEAEMLILA